MREHIYLLDPLVKLHHVVKIKWNIILVVVLCHVVLVYLFILVECRLYLAQPLLLIRKAAFVVSSPAAACAPCWGRPN